MFQHNLLAPECKKLPAHSILDFELGIGDCTSLRDATRTAPLCYQGLHFGSALLPGIALRLRSVTRDWGWGMGDWGPPFFNWLLV
ncbi:MAG: hypothetical protein ACFKPT_17330 [Gloeotrichia echinulata GP01]